MSKKKYHDRLEQLFSEMGESIPEAVPTNEKTREDWLDIAVPDNVPHKVRQEVRRVMAGNAGHYGDIESLLRVIPDQLSWRQVGLLQPDCTGADQAEPEFLSSSPQSNPSLSLKDVLTTVTQPAEEGGAVDGHLFYLNLDEQGQPEGLTLTATWSQGKTWQPVRVRSAILVEDFPDSGQFFNNLDQPLFFEDLKIDSLGAVFW